MCSLVVFEWMYSTGPSTVTYLVPRAFLNAWRLKGRKSNGTGLSPMMSVPQSAQYERTFLPSAPYLRPWITLSLGLRSMIG